MLRQGQRPEARARIPGASLVLQQRWVVKVLTIRPCVTLAHHLAIDIAPVEVNLPKHAIVAVLAFGQHANLVPEHLVRERLPCPRTPRLGAFRRVDFRQPKTRLELASIVLEEQGHGIAIGDANNKSIQA